MLSARHERSFLKCPVPSPAQGSASSSPESAPAFVPKNNFFQEFIRTCIKKVRDQALAAPAAPVAKARDNTDNLLKSKNLNLYHNNLYMECYYFCQQCEDHFEVAISLDHKYVSFAAGFLKDHILNQWQQYNTRIQCNQLALMTQDEFKAFLRKSLGESNAFVGYVWNKLRGDAQHQLEKVQD